jgi:hypothetical protein
VKSFRSTDEPYRVHCMAFSLMAPAVTSAATRELMNDEKIVV